MIPANLIASGSSDAKQKGRIQSSMDVDIGMIVDAATIDTANLHKKAGQLSTWLNFQRVKLGNWLNFGCDSTHRGKNHNKSKAIAFLAFVLAVVKQSAAVEMMSPTMQKFVGICRLVKWIG